MATEPRQIIKNLCPELFNNPALDDFIQMAAELTDRSFFGNLLAPYAIAYRACHLFTITGSGGGGNFALGMGQITSMSEGGLSVAFAQSQSNDGSALDTTKYGKLLLGLIKSRPTMGVNTAGLHGTRPL